VMMESPLAPPTSSRDSMRTVEANVDELMAAVRQNADAEPPTLVADVRDPA